MAGVHSAGDIQIGYALSLHGGSSRSVKNATPDASGVCGNAGGTQTGWNIKWVDVASGAGGGSELADLGYWLDDPLTADLRTGSARALYDHNNTQSLWFYMFAGAKGTLYSGILPGQDDEALSYHSTGGLSATGSFCNPGDWFCDGALELGTVGSSKGGAVIAKWSRHLLGAWRHPPTPAPWPPAGTFGPLSPPQCPGSLPDRGTVTVREICPPGSGAGSGVPRPPATAREAGAGSIISTSTPATLS